ncbi:MAG: N-acetyl sugar amidotransferase [Flavisolibacter sp.]|nr:N-acetyl sugar amidotransferase [Flavisolibacter sp.]
MNKLLKVCSRCIYDERVPRISFDEQGVCNYCKMSDSIQQQYKTGTSEGEATLFKIIEEIKRGGKGKQYDCVVGVSGGTDSSFTLAKTVEWGLRPLAVHFDNTWNTAIASQNIYKMVTALNVDLATYVVDNQEMDAITHAFFVSGVPELDCPTDIALAEVLYRYAAKYKVKYIIEGHSFVTEGISPIGTNYFDGKYIMDICAKHGNQRHFNTFPNMNFFSFMKWIAWKRIKKIRPLWYIDYSKEKAREWLQQNFGWEYYGGHHLENRLSAFTYSVYKPQKFGIDDRNWSLAAAARNHLMPREKALCIYNTPIPDTGELKDYFLKRLHLSEKEYEGIIKGTKRTYRDFKTYKKTFERLRPFFYLMAKAQLIPLSFYIKYTSKTEGA